MTVISTAVLESHPKEELVLVLLTKRIAGQLVTHLQIEKSGSPSGNFTRERDARARYQQLLAEASES